MGKRNNAVFLSLVIVGDKSLVFQYNRETKKQSMQWETAEIPGAKKMCRLKFKIKAVLIAFLDKNGLVHCSSCQSVQQQHFYQPVLVDLHGRV